VAGDRTGLARPPVMGKAGAQDRAAAAAGRGKDRTMAISVNLEKGLDKAYENKSLDEILAAPPSALAGLTEKHDEQLREALGIKTIADLGSNKYFALAGVLVALGNKQG
jgi:hypothetical protein